MKIEFICTDDVLLQHWTPKPASECLPAWFEKVPRYEDHDFFGHDVFDNIKACTPMVDMINAGYIIPCCSEFMLKHKVTNFRKELFVEYLNVTESIPGSTRTIQSLKNLKILGEKQMPTTDKKTRQIDYFKFTSEWGIITPPGYSTLIIQPFYHYESRYRLFPAILDTDKYHKGIPIAGMALTNENVKIKPGDALVQVIPFKRDEWQMEAGVKTIADATKFYFREGYKTLCQTVKKFL